MHFASIRGPPWTPSSSWTPSTLSRLSGQTFEWSYGYFDDRSGSEKLTTFVLRNQAKRRAIPIVEGDEGVIDAGAVGRVDTAVVDAGQVPPAPRPFGFVVADGGGARKAADGEKTHGMQRIHDDVGVRGDVRIEIGRRQIDEGVHAQHAHLGVELEHVDFGTGAPLIAPQPGDEGVVASAHPA